MGRGMLAAVLVGVALAVVSGCGPVSSLTIGRAGSPTVHGRRGHGPPPHAPAHGERRKHRHADDGWELVFDSNLGVYVVVDLPDYYYWDGYYLRIEDGRWQASTRVDGEWQPRSEDSLPPGLRKKHAKGRPKHHRGRGRGPAKKDW
jgi:hypothetical protein